MQLDWFSLSLFGFSNMLRSISWIFDCNKLDLGENPSSIAGRIAVKLLHTNPNREWICKMVGREWRWPALYLFFLQLQNFFETLMGRANFLYYNVTKWDWSSISPCMRKRCLNWRQRHIEKALTIISPFINIRAAPQCSWLLIGFFSVIQVL